MAALALERADPSLRNLVVTAEELTRRGEGTPSYMRTRVLADAARRLAAADLSAVARISSDATALLVSVVLLVTAASVRVSVKELVSGPSDARKSGPTAISNTLLVDIVPPSYAGRPSVQLTNPASLEALAGSHAMIRVPDAAGADIRLNGNLLAVTGGVAQAALTESGYLAVDAGPMHRLLPLTVTPDRAPAVQARAESRVTVAGKTPSLKENCSPPPETTV